MTNEMLTLKMNILGGMDAYIRETIKDSNILKFWNIDGVPENATEEDLKSIAEVEDAWTSVCVWFGEFISGRGGQYNY